jgi:hypothetical protein
MKTYKVTKVKYHNANEQVTKVSSLEDFDERVKNTDPNITVIEVRHFPFTEAENIQEVRAIAGSEEKLIEMFNYAHRLYQQRKAYKEMYE